VLTEDKPRLDLKVTAVVPCDEIGKAGSEVATALNFVLQLLMGEGHNNGGVVCE